MCLFSLAKVRVHRENNNGVQLWSTVCLVFVKLCVTLHLNPLYNRMLARETTYVKPRVAFACATTCYVCATFVKPRVLPRATTCETLCNLMQRVCNLCENMFDIACANMYNLRVQQDTLFVRNQNLRCSSNFFVGLVYTRYDLTLSVGVPF